MNPYNLLNKIAASSALRATLVKSDGKLQEKTDGARFHSIQLPDEDFIRVRSYYCDEKTCFDFEGAINERFSDEN